ncbi:hypothetical protein HNP69_000287 [Chryseobacterium koreense]|nr:hypothetical protein [Chryseobacterium koreense]
MKKLSNILISFFSILFSSINIYAQTKTYTQSMDSLLVYLDKSQMVTPILYDRVFSNYNSKRQIS